MGIFNSFRRDIKRLRKGLYDFIPGGKFNNKLDMDEALRFIG